MKNGVNEAYALVQLQLEGFILHYQFWKKNTTEVSCPCLVMALHGETNIKQTTVDKEKTAKQARPLQLNAWGQVRGR